MSAHYASWFPTVAAAVVMLFLGMRTRLLSPPQLKVRCVWAPRQARAHLSLHSRQDGLTPSSRSVARTDSASSTV